MTPARVTPAEIARVSGLTEKHVRRMMGRVRGVGHWVDYKWFGTRPRIHDTDTGPEIEFATLPDHIREAFVLKDQPMLPLPGLK